MRGKGKRVGKNLTVGMTALLTVSLLSSPLTALGAGAAEDGIRLNHDIHYQTLEGWGSSLCWWGNVIGSWGDKDFNGNGTPDREEIAELAFSPEYLNLNIMRYNVGGGDNPAHDHMKRCEGEVPGWSSDMGIGEDGSGAYDEASFMAKNSEDMADAGQLWMLEQANAYRKAAAEEQGTKNDVINKVFSNSPPYYMTNSGCSTGANNAWEDNLRGDQFAGFADYMTYAAKWINRDLQDKYGVGVDYIEPMNEPDTGYWGAGSTKQEGCHFSPGATQNKMIQEMQASLDREGMGDVAITGTDETSLGSAINSYNQLDTKSKNSLTTISAHTYSGDNNQRSTLRDLAASYEKGLWMSEVCKGGGGHDHDSMAKTNAKDLSGGIIADLKYMQPTAWIAWLVGDSEYECLQTDSNWGLIHTVFEEDGQPVAGYHDSLLNEDGTRKEGVPGEGYWAVTKQFYTMMQYSKYLKAGYTLVDIEDDNMVAAISPDKKEAVIVAQNFGSARSIEINVSGLTHADRVEAYRTSNQENCEPVREGGLSNGMLRASLPHNSVSTFVIKAGAESALYDDAGYTDIVNADVVYNNDTQSTGATETNKFTYSGDWTSYDGKYGQYGEDVNCTYGNDTGSVTFTFDGERAQIMGEKLPEGAKANVSVDGKPAGQIDTSAPEKAVNQIIFDTGELAAGKEHTVTLAMAAGQDASAVFCVDAARVLHIIQESEKIPVGLRIVNPAKMEYELGEELDVSGMEVTAEYADGSNEVVMDYVTSGFDSETPGDKTVTVSCRGVTAEFTVKVNDKQMTGITLILPDKIQYHIGETFDATGMSVEAVYSNGEKEVLKPESYTVTGFDSKTEGTKQVTVTYNEKAVTFQVKIEKEKSKPVLTKLLMAGDVKKEYAIGEAFDPAGLVVFACYSDGSAKEIKDYHVGSSDTSTAGRKALAITYQGISAELYIEVKAAKEELPNEEAPKEETEKWMQNSSEWWYLNTDGSYPADCWQSIDNAWYYFNGLGYMQTGWLNRGGTWYYLQNNGAMATGWLYEGGSWYYLSDSGAMATGWLYEGGNWYYLQGSGAMKAGWLYEGENWYYLQRNGAMVTGWYNDSRSWYYLRDNGAMAANEWIGNDYVSANGNWIR